MDILEKVATLRREGRAFALATVVSRQAPVSAHLGDRAIVLADGRMEGFVGGACSHEIIRQQALDALKVRQPRLVSIRPDPSQPGETTRERVTVPMTCVSEGAIDVFVEPFVQPRRLVVVGATPVAEALARIGRSLDYDVVRVVDPGEQPDVEAAAGPGVSVAVMDALETLVGEGASRGLEQAAVVASQGHYDEQALERILKGGVPYVGLVASRKRAAAVSALLAGTGVPGVETIRNPAGLDLGARTPAEVALSILAEIVQVRPSLARVPAQAGPVEAPASAAALSRAIDPVCGMSVAVAGARHTAEVEGVAYYFCSAGCRARFLEDPRPFLAQP